MHHEAQFCQAASKQIKGTSKSFKKIILSRKRKENRRKSHFSNNYICVYIMHLKVCDHRQKDNQTGDQSNDSWTMTSVCLEKNPSADLILFLHKQIETSANQLKYKQSNKTEQELLSSGGILLASMTLVSRKQTIRTCRKHKQSRLVHTQTRFKQLTVCGELVSYCVLNWAALLECMCHPMPCVLTTTSHDITMSKTAPE